MAEPIKISNSEISCFKQCRRKWWLTYYRGLQFKSKTLVGPLALGNRVHAALEAYYVSGAALVPTYSALLEEDRQIYIAEEKELADLESEGELGRVMLEGYLEWLEETGADAGIEVVAAERIIEAPVLDGRAFIRGKVDMKVRRLEDDAIQIWDHKTSARPSDLTTTAHMSEQFLMYSLLEFLNPPEDGRVAAGGVYNILRKVKRGPKAKPPFYERYEVRFNKTSLQNFWTRVHGEISDILALRAALDAGADHQLVCYPRPTRDCTWSCNFYHACTMFDDGSHVEGYLNEFYEVGDPDARYSEDLTISNNTAIL